MKSVLIIGMGRFGKNLAKEMQRLGNDVMIIDRDASLIADLAPIFPDAQVADCRSEAALRALGVQNFDICFVTTAGDLGSAAVITALLKKMNAPRIVVKASNNLEGDILRKVGADEVIQPERRIAERLAVKYNTDNVFDFIELTDGYALYEIPVLPAWVGKTLIEIDVRRKYHLNIIALKRHDTLDPTPDADVPFMDGDHIIVVGQRGDVEKVAAKA